MMQSRILSITLFVSLMGALTLGTAAPAAATEGGSSEESSAESSEKTSKASKQSEKESTDKGSTESKTDTGRPTPPRGDLGTEVGGSFAGFGIGALGMGLITMGVGSAVFRNNQAAFPPEFAVGVTGAVLGGFAFTGTGAGLAGKWTGGNGDVGWAMIGSTIGGIGGLAVPVGLGAVIGNAASSDAPVIIGYVTGALFGLGGASIGGLLGYRMSAKPLPGDSASAKATIRPFAAPNFDGGGRAGFSVSF